MQRSLLHSLMILLFVCLHFGCFYVSVWHHLYVLERGTERVFMHSFIFNISDI